MESEGFSDNTGLDAPGAPLAPPAPAPQFAPAPGGSAGVAPTEQMAQIPPAVAASSVVLPPSAAPAKRSPVLAIVGGVVIVGLAAAAAIGWMGKADAEDDAAASKAEVAALTQDVADLRTEVETANQAAEATAGELDAATSNIADLEGQISDLDGQVADLETEIAEKDAQIATLEQADNDGGAIGEPLFNDLVLTEREYEVVASVTPIAPPPIEAARSLGADVCAAEDLPSVVAAVTAHLGDFPPGTSLDDAAKVAGAIAGLMCVNHLQELAG